MYSFTYHRPGSARQAANLLAKNPEAKLLAGGHSLIPVMKLRLAKPSAIIDLNGIEDLAAIELKGRSISIGAMARHADVANSKVVRDALPGLASVPASIGDPQVRNRGTIGGSVANNDPNADYPAACLGLGATIVTNKRRIAADDFFTGMFSTALEENEIILRVSFPIAKKAAYEKFKHPASGFALVGVFASKRGLGNPRRGDRRRRERRVPGEVVRGGAEEALLAEIAGRHDHSGQRHEQRHSRFGGIPRASGCRTGAPRRGEGDRARRGRNAGRGGGDVTTFCQDCIARYGAAAVRWCLAAVCFLSVATADAQTIEKIKVERSDGAKVVLPVEIHLPKTATGKLPAILIMHGSSGVRAQREWPTRASSTNSALPRS